MRQLFYRSAIRAQRRRQALDDAAAFERLEYDAAVRRLSTCPTCMQPFDVDEFPIHFETDHAALMNDPVC